MAQKNLETDFELMFESAPISLWLENCRVLKVVNVKRQTLSMFLAANLDGIDDSLADQAMSRAKTRFYEEAKLERRRI